MSGMLAKAPSSFIGPTWAAGSLSKSSKVRAIRGLAISENLLTRVSSIHHCAVYTREFRTEVALSSAQRRFAHD